MDSFEAVCIRLAQLTAHAREGLPPVPRRGFLASSVGAMVGLVTVGSRAGAARLKDPDGSYCILDDVVVAPGAGSSVTLKATGRYVHVSPRSIASSHAYYFFYSTGSDRQTAAEWDTLIEYARAGKVLALGNGWRGSRPRVVGVPPIDPDPYPVGSFREISATIPRSIPDRLLVTPTPLYPLRSDVLRPGRATLRVRVPTGGSLLTGFQLTQEGSAIEQHSGVEEIDGTAAWQPMISLKPGTYVWSAWTVDQQNRRSWQVLSSFTVSG